MNEEQTDSAIKWLSSKISDNSEPITYEPCKIRRKCWMAVTGLHTFHRMRNGDLYCVYCNLNVRQDDA